MFNLMFIDTFLYKFKNVSFYLTVCPTLFDFCFIVKFFLRQKMHIQYFISLTINMLIFCDSNLITIGSVRENTKRTISRRVIDLKFEIEEYLLKLRVCY